MISAAVLLIAATYAAQRPAAPTTAPALTQAEKAKRDATSPEPPATATRPTITAVFKKPMVRPAGGSFAPPEKPRPADIKPVLIWFSASWCGPCQQMKPIVDELTAAGVDVSKCDADCEEDQRFFDAYNVRSLPTFIVAA
ncbi:MAG: hypothetical protein LLG00_16700, partial [Planctomycetaceae bacterium]|nr:hypothetical protein [Planctomycetaceae bacterium]